MIFLVCVALFEHFKDSDVACLFYKSDFFTRMGMHS